MKLNYGLTFFAAATTLALLMATGSQTARAGGVETNPLDVEGLWVGNMTCKGLLLDGSKIKESIAVSMAMDQLEGAPLVATSFTAAEFGPRGTMSFGDEDGLCGTAVAKAGSTSKGSLQFGNFGVLGIGTVLIPAAFPVSSIYLSTVKVSDTPNGKGQSGTAKGILLIEAPGSGIPAHLGCSLKLARVSQDEPTSLGERGFDNSISSGTVNACFD